MIERSEMYTTYKTMFVPALLLLSATAMAQEINSSELIAAQTINQFCIQTALNNSNFENAIKYAIESGFIERSQKLDNNQLVNIGNADLGILAKIGENVYAIAIGQRKLQGLTPFCSVTTEISHLEARELVENQFTTFKLNSTEVIGGDEVATYRGYLPGFSHDLAIGLQSSWGMTSIGLFEFLP